MNPTFVLCAGLGVVQVLQRAFLHFIHTFTAIILTSSKRGKTLNLTLTLHMKYPTLQAFQVNIFYVGKAKAMFLASTVSADVQYLIASDVAQVRRSSALFILKLKEQRRVSQVAVDDIVESCKSLFSQTIVRVQAGVRAKLAEAGIEPHAIDGLGGVFDDVTDPFQGLETCHLQEKYFRDELGLVVSYLMGMAFICICTYMFIYVVCQPTFSLSHRNHTRFELENLNTGHSFLERNAV